MACAASIGAHGPREVNARGCGCRYGPACGFSPIAAIIQTSSCVGQASWLVSTCCIYSCYFPRAVSTVIAHPIDVEAKSGIAAVDLEPDRAACIYANVSCEPLDTRIAGTRD